MLSNAFLHLLMVCALKVCLSEDSFAPEAALEIPDIAIQALCDCGETFLGADSWSSVGNKYHLHNLLDFVHRRAVVVCQLWARSPTVLPLQGSLLRGASGKGLCWCLVEALQRTGLILTGFVVL